MYLMMHGTPMTPETGRSMPLTLTALSSASQRTKNRIREHGPVFKARQWSMSVNAMDNRACVLVESPDDWSGWLPLDEIEEKLIPPGE